MNGYTITETVTLNTTTCADCGIIFAIPAPFEARRREDGRSFYCPSGHNLVFNGEIDKLRRRVASLQSTNVHLSDQRAAAERSAAAYKGQATKLRRRAQNGVCAVCHRSFEDVRRHMTTQHPEATR